MELYQWTWCSRFRAASFGSVPPSLSGLVDIPGIDDRPVLERVNIYHESRFLRSTNVPSHEKPQLHKHHGQSSQKQKPIIVSWWRGLDGECEGS